MPPQKSCILYRQDRLTTMPVLESRLKGLPCCLPGKTVTYVDDALQQLESKRGAQIALQGRDDEVELLLHHMGELHAVHLLQDKIDQGIITGLTKKGSNLNSLSSLNELVMPTFSRNMSWVVANSWFSISRRTRRIGQSRGVLTVLVEDGVAAHGHYEKLRDHI